MKLYHDGVCQGLWNLVFFDFVLGRCFFAMMDVCFELVLIVIHAY